MVLDGAAGGISNLYKGDQFSTTDAAVPEPKPAKKERRAPPQTGKPSKSSELDAAAAKGIMPQGLTVGRRTLEDVFLELTGRELR